MSKKWEPISDDTFYNGGEVDISAHYYPGAKSPADRKYADNHCRLSLRKNGMHYEAYVTYFNKHGAHGQCIQEVIISTTEPAEFIDKANEVYRDAMLQIGARPEEISTLLWVPITIVLRLREKYGRKCLMSMDYNEYVRTIETYGNIRRGEVVPGLPSTCPECGAPMAIATMNDNEYVCAGSGKHAYATWIGNRCLRA